MTAPAPLAFPGSRTLAGWWRQLAPLQPRGLWIAHLFLHRIEALVSVVRPCRADLFQQLILKALALAAGESAGQLDRRLHLGSPFLGRVLAGLQREGLVASSPESPWRLTPTGRQALEHGEYPRVFQERRTFAFMESTLPDQPPHFLNLNPAPGIPWLAPEGWGFDPAVLQGCIEQPVQWKQRVGFPLDVQKLLVAEETPDPDTSAANGKRDSELPRARSSWQRVMLDRPERLLTALVVLPAVDGGECLHGYPIRQEGWAMQAEPAFTLPAGWQEIFPELELEPPPEQWRDAWRMWCQPRGLTGPETESCPLRREGHRLQAELTSRFVERLRSARNDALKGEAWILAGEERIRTAAQLEILEVKAQTASSPG